MQKLGKKEDAHIVASDAQLDAKLEVLQFLPIVFIQVVLSIGVSRNSKTKQ